MTAELFYELERGLFRISKARYRVDLSNTRVDNSKIPYPSAGDKMEQGLSAGDIAWKPGMDQVIFCLIRYLCVL